MSIARQLFELQELDLEIESRQRNLDILNGQLGETEALKKARAEVASAQERLVEIRKQQKSAEWEVEDLASKINDIDKKLYGGTIRNPKELSSLQQEGEGFKARRATLEDNILHLMSQIELAAAELERQTASLSSFQQEWQGQRRKIEGGIQAERVALTSLEGRRNSLLGTVTPANLRFYRSLREHKGLAVARVEQGRCCGCRILLPTTDLQRSRNTMVHCSSCGRILFTT